MQKTLLSLLAGLAVAACGERPQPPAGAQTPPAGTSPTASDPNAPAARIGKDVITMREVDAMIVGTLRRAAFEAEKQMYQARAGALDQIIMERIIGPKAKAKGQDIEAFLKAEVAATVPDASEGEARLFYDQNTDQMGGQPFEAMKERIVRHLTNQQRAGAFQKYMDDARKAAGVEVVLAEPEEARVEVAAVGPSKGPEGAPITLIEFSDFQ
jgi:hypothetical protein